MHRCICGGENASSIQHKHLLDKLINEWPQLTTNRKTTAAQITAFVIRPDCVTVIDHQMAGRPSSPSGEDLQWWRAQDNNTPGEYLYTPLMKLFHTTWNLCGCWCWLVLFEDLQT